MDDKRSHHVQVRTIDKVNEYDEKEGENSQENENNGENIRLPSNTGIKSSNTSSQQSRMTFFGRWTGAAETSNEPSSGSSPPSHNIPTQRNTIARVLNRFASSTTPMQNTHPSGNRHTFLRMFSTRHPARSTPASSTTNRRMLTYGQLSDLFRRLDKDGNGELDLEEFTQIINKLKINATEDFVAR